MRFAVTGLDTPPCEGATLRTHTVTERFWADFVGEQWKTKGRNHRVEGEYAMRDADESYWTVEIGSLDELVELCRMHGHQILLGTNGDYANGEPELQLQHCC